MPVFEAFYKKFQGIQEKLAAAGVETFEYAEMDQWAIKSPARTKLVEALKIQDISLAEVLVFDVAAGK